MSKRVVLALAAVLAAGIAAFAGAGPASAVVCECGTAQPDPPAAFSPHAATVAIAAPGAGGVSAPMAVDSVTVLAAVSAPGADTEIESDLTAEQAAGLEALPASRSMTSARSRCWRDEAWWQWGTWPYQQRITDTTYWCARYGVKITLRTSSVSAGGTLCGVSWRAAQLIGGGIGFPGFTERTSAGFACPTVVPWITLHTTHHLDVRRDDRGNASIMGTG